MASSDSHTVTILFIGKRFYTNRDALEEHYGRIWQLPWHWARAGIPTQLWLIDYHSREQVVKNEGLLEVVSTPVRGISAFRQWLRARKTPVQTVVASGDCYIGLMAYRLARRLGARFVFDVYDKYDEFGAYRRLPGFDPLRFLLEAADVRMFASRALHDDLCQAPERDLLVPNGVDTQRFVALDRDASRRQLELPRDLSCVGYFGGMEPDRGVADLIEAVGQLREQGLGVELLLGGKRVAGVDVDADGVRYLGNVPYAQMPTVLAACDLLAVPYRRSAFMDAGASNKIAEAIACRRPLVATRTPNLMANFPEQAKRLGDLLATPGDATDLARVIQAQLRQPRLVNMPTGMGWPEIAGDVAAGLALIEHEPTRPGEVAG